MGRVPHLLLLELDDERKPGRLRDLFEGSGYELGRADPDVNRFDVSPDGKRVVFAFDPSTVKMPDGRMALAEMELKSGKVTAIAQDREWNFTAPRYSPDGNRIAFLASHQGRKHTMPDQLAVWERDGAWDVASGEWDHEVQAPLLWEDDGLSLLLRAEQKGRTHLWRFDLQDRRAEIVVTGGCVTAFDKCAGTLVTVTDSALHPGRLHAHPPGEAPLRIESFNDELFDGIELSAVEEVWFEGAGSIRSSADEAAAAGDDDARDPVQMWLAFPPGFDASDRKTRHPVMHVIHGGPHTAAGDTWHYRWNMQVFAAQGYVVASVNYHGSSSFGHAFLDSITHRWGELELQDIEAATDWLMHKHWVDKRRIVATGGSYGGFMVAWMNGHVPPGRYQAYVCHAGCFDWVGMFADDTYTWHPRELGARYWNDMDKVLSQSPHAHVAGMRTPTLVIHGALDFRVPDAQGLAYYNTLKALNVPARLLWFPDENHWVLKPRNSRLWHEEFFAWLKLYSSAPIK
jgi:dipeptidyl aminopeptidase/acylaminoacyl peptidase